MRCHEIAGKVSGNETRFMARLELLREEMEKLRDMGGEIEETIRGLGFEAMRGAR